MPEDAARVISSVKGYTFVDGVDVIYALKQIDDCTMGSRMVFGFDGNSQQTLI